MSFIKKYLKLIVGIAVLLLAAVIFFSSMRTENLEDGDMRTWIASSVDRRSAAVKILIGSETNSDTMVSCLDKMATLPDSQNVKVRDAAALCYTGLLLKDNI